MRSKKLNYSFSIDQIIEGNLSVQSIQKSLKDNFGILKPSLTILKNPNFIKNYKNWDETKKHLFIKTIGGVVYYGKIKKYLNEIIENNGEKI
ncbi:MAG: hypothetical protein EBR82_30765 [Caulobacteraceae bacterium]|nr:hypothetical protein [Caulobacteraceae bacterium]